MSSQPIPPVVPPTGDDDDLAAEETVLADDDRPLDPDLDDDRVDSAAADERAATEGTLDTDDRP